MGAAPLVLGGLSAIASFEGARQQNKYARRQAKAQNQALAIQAEQLGEQSQQQMTQQQREAARIQGRLRVAAGESGLGAGGTFDALTRQTTLNLSENIGNIQSNLANNLNLLSSRQVSEDANRVDPLLAGLTGGIGGYSTGMNLETGTRQLNQMRTKSAQKNWWDF